MFSSPLVTFHYFNAVKNGHSVMHDRVCHMILFLFDILVCSLIQVVGISMLQVFS